MSPRLTSEEFTRRAAELEWLLCDVDGVLTDGGLYFDHTGQRLMRFHVRDGLGMKLAQKAGVKVGLLSGRSSPALDRRAGELGLDLVVSGSADKAADFADFLEQHQTSPRRVAYIGDDLNDIVLLGRVGLSFAPADAAPEVRAVVHRVLESAGGRGAVREMVEVVLRHRGDWETVLSPFTFDG